MDEDRVEKHHLIFYTVTIIVIFLIEFFSQNVMDLKVTFMGFIIYIFLLILFTYMLLYVFYGWTASYFLGFDYRPKNPIYYRDVLLTCSAIIVAFLIDDLFNYINSLTTEYSFFLTIIFIPFLYLIIYKINDWFFPKIFR